MKNNRHTTTLLNLSGLAKFLLLTLIFSFLSCRKDVVDSITQGSLSKPVQLDEAKMWYSKHHNNNIISENTLTAFTYTPDWDFAQHIRYRDSLEVMTVPLVEKIDSFVPNADCQLLFFKDSIGTIQTRLMFFIASDAYVQTHGKNYNVADFTGFTMNIDEEGYIWSPARVENGVLTAVSLDSIFPVNNTVRGGGWPNWLLRIFYTVKCPGFGGNNNSDNWEWWSDFLVWLGSGGGNNGGGSSGGGNGGDNGGGGGFPDGGGNIGNSSGGGGTIYIGGSNYPPYNVIFNMLNNNLVNNYFSNDIFSSNNFKNKVANCASYFKSEDDSNTPLIFAMEKSDYGYGYERFLGAYDYYLDQLSQGNTNFQLKDAFAAVQTPPSTYKFFPNPFNLAQWKPKIEPIFEKMLKDFKDHKDCTGGLNSSPDGNSSCNCFEYMVEDMKGDFLRTLGILNNNFTNAQNQEAAEIYAVSYKYLIDELPKLKDDQPDLANPSFELFGRIFNRILSKKIGKVIPFVGSAIDLGSAWSYYQSGNYEAAALNMAIAIVGLIPAEALLEAGADIISICHTSWTAYKPFASLSEFFIAHPQYFENIYKTVDELDFIDKVEWIAINNNVKQFRINEMAPAQVEIFAQKLAENFNKTWDGNYLKIAGDDFLFYKYMDNSFGKWAMHINYYGKAFKIRFGY